MNSYLWNSEWVPTDAPAGTFDRAESWRHLHGRASGLDAHIRRFAGAPVPVPPGMWEAAVELLDPAQDLFPRVTVSGQLFRLDIRPAPPARATTSLTVTGAPDPRRTPLVKGPDLVRLADHRARYLVSGTDDVVLGPYAETTTGALVGWEGDVLVVPQAEHLPSVTQAQVMERARHVGLRVRIGNLGPTMPLWFLNSVHGISPVDWVVTQEARVRVPARPDSPRWAAWWWDSFQRPWLKG
ncbi:aminotransferase class IV [Corynebacterium qintianiae]|uniref:aminotransferase class IV n=1 Tax=Corynebacterium qintianiae TaxID=2709392 RepID=UPI0013EA4A1D|nr:aminotransferase class IV [Corynebacterium qintianiae]